MVSGSEDRVTNDRLQYRNGVGGGSVIEKDHVEQIRSSLLSPYEVKFCDVSSDEDEDDYNPYRKKLSSITELDAESILSSVNISNECKKKYPIPDGGWGWMVVAASFFLSLIADGVSFSFGLLYTEFLTYFKESPSKTSWIGALFLACPLLSGPIMSNLVDKYGCRKSTMISGVVAGVGFILAALSSSVEMLYLTFGVIGGVGLGIGYVTAVVSIAIWFDKKRSFATGIGASGTGLGTFVYAPFTQWLIEYYGWRGTVLILAGTMFNICVCGALMRDPDWLIEENRLESRSQSIQTFSNSSCNLDEIKKMLETGAKREDLLATIVTNFNTEANQQIPVPEEIELSKKYQSEMLLPTFVRSDELKISRQGSWRSLRYNKSDREAIEVKQNEEQDAKANVEVVKRNLASMETLNPSEKESYLDNNKNKSLDSLGSAASDENYRRFSLDETTMFRKPQSPVHELIARGMSLDAVDETEQSEKPAPHAQTLLVPNHHKEPTLTRRKKTVHGIKRHGIQDEHLKRNLSLRNSHYFHNMRIHRNSINYRGAMLNTHRYRLRASSCPNIYRNSMTTIAREEEEKWYDNFQDIIKSIFDFSLFLDSTFFTFSLATTMLFTWFIVPYFYITEHLLKHNYTEEDGANMIAVIGIFQTIGMIVLGWMGDQPWLNVPHAYAYSLVACGVSVAMMPVITFSYPLLICSAVVFGLTFASAFSYTPIIMVDIVDIDKFTVAYGLILLVQGVGNLVGPPLSSSFFIVFGRWDETFYIAGLFIAVAGCLVYLSGILLKRDKDREQKEKDENISYAGSERKFSSNNSGTNNNKFSNNSKSEVTV